MRQNGISGTKGKWVIVLNRMVQVGLIEKVIADNRLLEWVGQKVHLGFSIKPDERFVSPYPTFSFFPSIASLSSNTRLLARIKL